MTYFYVIEIMGTEDCTEHYNKEEIKELIPDDYDYFDPYRPKSISWKNVEIVTGVDISCKNVKLPLHYIVKNSCNDCKQTLTILSSNLSEIPNSPFVNIKNISKLVLKHLDIFKLSSDAFNELSLVEINLSNNRLSEINLTVFNWLANLEILDLSFNQISTIKNYSFGGVINLKTLNLSHNNLLTFSYKVFNPKMHPMDTLDLSFNEITHFTVDIKIKMKSLFLNNNELKEILNLCPNLFATVSLKDNHLKNLSSTFCTSKFNEIASFDVSCNNISSIDDFYFGEAFKLKSLNLNHNNLSSLSPGVFYNMSNLEYLNISYNNLEDFKFGTFDSLNNLEILDISNNNLHTISTSLHSLKNVHQFFIHNNHVQDINPDQLKRYFPNLRQLLFDSTNLSCDHVLNIVRQLKSSGIEILHNNLENITNTHGVSCLDSPEVDLVPETLNKTENETLKGYLDELKKSIFYKMLEQIYSSDKAKNVGYSRNVSSDKSLIDKYLEDNIRNTQNFNNYFRDFIENQKKLSHSQETLVYTEIGGYNKIVTVLSVITALLCLIALLIGYVLFKNNNSRASNVAEHVELVHN
ncbi:toll-like receptor 3 [Diabrotica virgifera virgifera]|uniref:Uncharacterized protein n=1 Tax=Diabrotica virgifera virgifera TaxID=50390 RepID=A0ABM5KNW0_DIAVI|nr:toll-like receptor 3 [Diabrotica virgifera virgifera]